MILFLRPERFKRFSWVSIVFVLVAFFTFSDGCRSDQFSCRDGVECIRQSYRCDGGHDCDDGSDEVDCESPTVDDYLLVSVARQNAEATHVRPQIYQIDLRTGHSKPLLRTDPQTPASLAIDMKKQVLYFVDRSVEMISSVSLANSSTRVIYRDTTLTADIDGLAVDSVRERLYFCDGGATPRIVEINLSDQDRTQRIILSGSNLKPKALVIDETNRELYWSDWGSKPGIFVIGLEPNAQQQQLVAENIVMPNALAIDFKEEVMYWADAHYDRIEMANLYGQDRRVMVRESSQVHYYAMTISPQFLYLTDWTSSAVLRVDRTTNATAQQMPILSGLKTGIIYYNSNFTNVGRPGRNRPTVASTQTTFTTSAKENSDANKSVKTVALEKTTLTTNAKEEAEKLVSGNGVGTEIVIAAVVAGLLLLLLITLIVWFGLRHRRRTAELSLASFGYSQAIVYDDSRSSRGRLLIEDAYVVRDNSYEHLPEVGLPPSPPSRRREPNGCGVADNGDEWYSKLDDGGYADVQSAGYYVMKKPTVDEYYDDTK